MELYQKIYVAPDFLDTEHGQIPCQECHGGNPQDPDWQSAHQGLTRDPTFPSAARTCGECHPDIVQTAEKSLHYTLAPMTQTILTRAGQAATPDQCLLKAPMERHCTVCHASCGQCHVSRPDYVRGGFLSKHKFMKKPPMNTTCASCHGGRVHGEFTGADEEADPDTHFEDQEMGCTDCHPAEELHADGTGIPNRRHLPQRPGCLTCHEGILSASSRIKAHASHGKKLACQICHAQAYKNCFACHVGTDKKGLPYFKCKKTASGFKIGLNPDKGLPWEFTLVRHVPVAKETFAFYDARGLVQFDAVPTWKPAAPHNILRKTDQNQDCNHCHGNPDLFLTGTDLEKAEVKANDSIIVPKDRIPKPISN